MAVGERVSTIQYNTLALGLMAALAVSGCVRAETANNSSQPGQAKPISLDLDCSNPASRIKIAELGADQRPVSVEITNYDGGLVIQTPLGLRLGEYAMPGYADSAEIWRELPPAGEEIGALGIDRPTPNFVVIASGEPSLNSHSDQPSWGKAGEAITAFCLYQPHNLNGSNVLVS